MLLNFLYDWGGLNHALFTAINGIRGPLVDALMLAGTQLGSAWNAGWIALGLTVLTAARRWPPHPALASRLPEAQVTVRLLLAFLLASAAALVLVLGAKHALDMPRPAVALPPGSVAVLAPTSEPYSLPSGHAAFAMLVAVVFWPYCPRRWRVALAAGALWVGLSRISVGAHFPADVVAGYLCGGACAALASRALPPRRQGS